MGVSWMKTGEESAKAQQENKQAMEAAKAEQGKALRFFLKKGAEGRIMFVDGELHPKLGVLVPPRFYEHFVNLGGQWMNVVCPQQSNPQAGDKCPICEGKDKPALVSLFTVVDLTPFTSKKTGKVIPFTRKLFVAKPTTAELLNTLAVKRGGLRGCVFDVYRKGEKAPAVGDIFDFIEKKEITEAVRQQYTVTFSYKKDGVEKSKTVCMADALDCGQEITYRTGDELRKMGFGAPTAQYSAPATTTPGNGGNEGAADASDYEQHL